MTNKNRQKNVITLKTILLVFLLGLPLVCGAILIALLIIPKGLPYYVTIILYFVLSSPLFIVFVYVVYRGLIPITGGMQLTKPTKWALFYPFMVGFGIFWALLSFIFETFTPTLPVEDREITLPILIIALITIILSTTRLRYPVARFFNKLFGTEPIKEEKGGISDA
jgi:hypothetical protein